LSTVIDVGGIKVSALNDGVVYLPPMYYPGLDFGAHPELLQADGTYRIPVGCFLIQAEDLTVLVDAGLGPSSIPFPGDIAVAAGLTDPPEVIAAGGLLPGALAAAGVAPTDISTVFLTHLHADHIGSVAPGGVLFFPDAVVMCSAVEWRTPPAAPPPGELEGRMGLAAAEAAGVLRLIDAATVELGPGISARHSPAALPVTTSSACLPTERVPTCLETPSTIHCSSMTRASRSFPRPSPNAHCGRARHSSRPCKGATYPSA
jgi:glyoxylase-like metal-dependent hydrolase (beta-lactamase superfamily II)